jgi:hypothetical protein
VQHRNVSSYVKNSKTSDGKDTIYNNYYLLYFCVFCQMTEVRGLLWFQNYEKYSMLWSRNKYTCRTCRRFSGVCQYLPWILQAFYGRLSTRISNFMQCFFYGVTVHNLGYLSPTAFLPENLKCLRRLSCNNIYNI